MELPKQKLFPKLPLALVLALAVSQVLVTKVTYKEVAVVRPSFKTTVQNLPGKISNQIKSLVRHSQEIVSGPKESLFGRLMPPPWIQPEVKPTIISYQPPAYLPPTSIPKPTSSPPLSILTPQPIQTPTEGFPPSFYPTSTPSPLPSPTPPPTQLPELPPSQKKAKLLGLINQERQKNGTTFLNYNSNLDRAAQAHAEDMVKNNYFSHTSKDGSTPADRALRAGYGSSWVGENIAKGITDPNSIFEMWMGSSGHRQNMLNPTWKNAGLGVSANIWVLLLGAK